MAGSVEPLKLLSLSLGGHYVVDHGHSQRHDNCTAEPYYVHWIWDSFRECVTDSVEYAGFILGLLQIICWIMVMFPQFYENYKQGKMDKAIAPAFLILWMMGDISNLVGCLLANQLATQLATAAYYLIMDFLIISQFTYYHFKNKRKHVQVLDLSDENSTIQRSANHSHVIYCCAFLVSTSLLMYLPWQQAEGSSGPPRSRSSGRSLLSTSHDSKCILYYHHTHDCVFRDATDVVGYVCGCFSGIFYVCSRLPQLYKNYQRKSVEGVSMLMFILTVLGNTFYGASILMEDTSAIFLIRHLPWLVGSLGTLFFDCIMLCQFAQFRYCRPRSLQTDDEWEEAKQHLLSGAI